jgi:lauroyl/myristoyl acyltransferase
MGIYLENITSIFSSALFKKKKKLADEMMKSLPCYLLETFP